MTRLMQDGCNRSATGGHHEKIFAESHHLNARNLDANIESINKTVTIRIILSSAGSQT
jgi:hypothetical protein